jgi:hypothetical protein
MLNLGTLLRAAVMLALTAMPVWADVLKHGDHEIHYTTFPSTIIPPDVASLHNITRAPNRIVVNVSALKQGEPAAIALSGTVTNLLEQVLELEFVEVNEQNAIYYLAHHVSLEHDLLRFNITAVVEGEPVEFEILRRYD